MGESVCGADKSPLISVIVPIYKVEPYLRRCVDSILSQTYTNLEIILVDDGSPDNCPAICDEYAKADKRVRVIHKKNGGVSDARNIGISAASGEYLMFVDSDDWLELDYIQSMSNSVLGFDWAISGITYQYNNSEKVVNAYNASLDQLVKKSILGYACNKIYSVKLFSNLYFDNFIREDSLLNLKVYTISQRYSLCDNNGYNYFQRDGSILHTRQPQPDEKVQTYINEIYNIISGLQNRSEAYMFYNNFVILLLSDHFVAIYNSNKKFRDKYISIKNFTKTSKIIKLVNWKYCDNFLSQIVYFTLKLKCPLLFFTMYSIIRFIKR